MSFSRYLFFLTSWQGLQLVYSKPHWQGRSVCLSLYPQMDGKKKKKKKKNGFMLSQGLYLSLPPIITGLHTRSMTQKSIIVGVRGGEGWAQVEARALLDYAGHRPTVQCGPDEPSWTWTQIWVQARMPDYSLNWTARSSAIQGWQWCQRCSSPTQMWLSWSQSPYSLKSVFVGQCSLASKPTAN